MCINSKRVCHSSPLQRRVSQNAEGHHPLQERVEGKSEPEALYILLQTCVPAEHRNDMRILDNSADNTEERGDHLSAKATAA